MLVTVLLHLFNLLILTDLFLVLLNVQVVGFNTLTRMAILTVINVILLAKIALEMPFLAPSHVLMV